jgi:hypothetical protein
MAMQDMLPADGSVYMVNMDNKMSTVMDALRAWEKKRGLSYSFKGKYVENRPKKTEEKPKAKAPASRPSNVPAELPEIKVPRERMKPGRRATLTKEERRQRKNENNKQYRIKHNAESRQRSQEWRAKQTPEQRAFSLQRVRDYKRAQKAAKLAAANAGGSVQAAGLPLANAPVS